MALDNFFQFGAIPKDVMVGHYSLTLVILSYIMAVFASYVAILIASDLKKYHSKKIYWDLLAGAFAMGAGIFTMHFIGMLAFIMPMPMDYNLWITLLSFLIAVLASGLAFTLVSVKDIGWMRLILGGVVLGLAIVSMHYTGMAAMRDVHISYLPSLFFLSIVVAIVSSFIALSLMLISQKLPPLKQRIIALIGALIMGCGICGMHYIGMAATVITPQEMIITSKHQIFLNHLDLSFLLAFVASLIMVITLVFRGIRVYVFFHLLTGYIAILFLIIPLVYIAVKGLQIIRDSTNKTEKILPRLNSLNNLKILQDELKILNQNKVLNNLLEEKSPILEKKIGELSHWESNYALFIDSKKSQAIDQKLKEFIQQIIQKIRDKKNQELANALSQFEIFLNRIISKETNNLKLQIAETNATIKETIKLALYLLGIAIFLACLISFYEASYFTKKFRTLKELAENVSKGNLNYRVPITSQDELSRLTQSFNHMVDALSEAKQKQKEFMSIAAHDLRNPLSVIMEGASIMPSLGNLTKKQEKMINMIYTASNSMLVLLNELLALNTYESQTFTVNKLEVDIAKFAQDLFDLNDLLAKKKMIKFHFSMDLKRETGFFDIDKIAQVVNNFLNNAFKFSKPESTVLLLVKGDNNKLRFEVHDEAGGIPYNEQDKVFTKFSKISVKPTDGESSTGLGLAICKDIIQAHQGEIGFNSVPGKGSTFYFEISIDKL